MTIQTRRWSQYSSLFGLDSFRQRLKILVGAYQNHRFERKSPIRPIGDDLLHAIFCHEVVFPPRNVMLQPGTQTLESLYFLLSLAKGLNARRVLEIGTYTGVTTWAFARNLCEATVITLDIPPQQRPMLETESSDTQRAREDNLLYEHLPYGSSKIDQVWADSAMFDFSPYKNSCDMVLIDGAHSRPYVESDTINALMVAAESSVIVWDDYWRFSKGVTGFLNELARERDLVRVPETRFVVLFADGAEDRFVADRSSRRKLDKGVAE